MIRIFLVTLGGGMGSLLRYAVNAMAIKTLGDGFPWGTMIVNLFGSFAIGFLGGWFEFSNASYLARLFLITGVLGGFTTFSAFSLENLNLLRSGSGKLAALNILVSIIGGVILAAAGFFLAETLAQGSRIGKG